MKNIRNLLIAVLLLLSRTAEAQMDNADNLQLLELLQSQRYTEAAELLKNKNPEPIGDKKVLSRIGYSLQQAGLLSEAETYYTRILDQDSTDIPAMFSLAALHQRKGNMARATHFYANVIRQDSLNFSAYKQISFIIESYATVLQAGPYLDKANSLNPIDSDVAYTYAKFLKELKQYPRAMKVLDTALSADTSNLMLLKGKAELAYATKDWPEVLLLTKLLMNNGDESIPVLKMRAEAFYYTKEYREAIALYEKMEQNDMKSEGTMYYTAMSYKYLNNYSKALEYFDKTIKESISPNVAQYHSQIADLHEKNKQLRKSLASLQKSLFFEERPITYYSMAVLYDQQLKETRTALTYYKRYLNSKPPADHKSYIEYSTYRIAQLSQGK